MSGTLCRCQKLAGPDVALHPRCFSQLWLLEGAPVEAWEQFAGDLLRRRLDAGESLFRQGDPADSMWLIKAGSVKLWKATEDGRVLTLDIRKAGDLLGENVLTQEGGTYPVAATCLEPTVTCGIDRGTFEALVTQYPSVGLVVIRNLARRIDLLSGKLGALSELSLEDRLYEVLVSVARDVGTPAPEGRTLAFPLTHEEIGFLVGAHRQVAGRNGPGTGFLIRGRAAFAATGPEFERAKARFSWARAALVITILSAEQTL